eukprot:SM000148S01011  [mRNA]  locus=s148:7138:12640:- [translate_table: standard]
MEEDPTLETLVEPGSAVGGGVRDTYGEDAATVEQAVTPWIRGVASGVELLRDPRFNKGTAFGLDERGQHYLHGLLPPACLSQDLQLERVMRNLRILNDPLQQYMTLMDLQDRNERLFFSALVTHVEELMPIVYTPTVGEACQKYSDIFRRPRGLYISIKDKGRVLELLRNWPEHNVTVIVVTDGERILGLGDLGVQGMGIPVGKLALYTGLGGIRPSEEYDALIEEFMDAVKQLYGEKILVQVRWPPKHNPLPLLPPLPLAFPRLLWPFRGQLLVLQFEDFANHNAFRLLDKYRCTHLTFNDDIQAGTGIAELLAFAISRQGKISLEEGRAKIWTVDSKGLIVKSRMESLAENKKPFAHDAEEQHDLLSSIKAVKPSAIVGTTGQRSSFTKEVVEEMAKLNKRPIIFALSNPTSKSECTAEEAYTWSESNNAYIFPGMGLGLISSGSIRATEDMFLAAAEAVASCVTDKHREDGLVFPPMSEIREVSARIGAAVAQKCYDIGVATRLPKPDDLYEYCKGCMFTPTYRKFR